MGGPVEVPLLRRGFAVLGKEHSDLRRARKEHVQDADGAQSRYQLVATTGGGISLRAVLAVATAHPPMRRKPILRRSAFI